MAAGALQSRRLTQHSLRVTLQCVTAGRAAVTLVLPRCGPRLGYTLGMKTAVSIPDQVFEEAERLAEELKTSRSQLYSKALAEFVARHAPDRVTETMNRVIQELGADAEMDEFSRRAARRVLEQVDW